MRRQWPRSNGLSSGHPGLRIRALVAVSTRAELGTLGDMTSWVTYAEAAEILGCHVSNVSKLVDKGQLSSTGQRGASFDRDGVEELARRRQARREMLEQRTRKYQRIDHRPDHEHEWLSPREVAELLGVTPQAVLRRIRTERLPGVEHGGRRWVRRDHLEQVEAARLARKTRRP